MLGVRYMLVTFLAVVVLAVVALLAVAQGILYARRGVMHVVADGVGPIAADLLAARSPGASFAAYLSRPIRLNDDSDLASLLVQRETNGYAVVTRPDGTLWFDTRAGDPWMEPTSTGSTPPLRRSEARQLARAVDRGVERASMGLLRTSLATPLRDDEGRVVGALLQTSSLLPASPGMIGLALGTLPLAALLAVLVGTTFGLTASRPLVRRLEGLASAADAWSRGDFSRSVHDPSRDELGRLARRLDRMAMQLSDLLRVRQAMATTHERARLASELHDSVKQQLFAASMLLSTAGTSRPADRASHVAAASDLIEEAKRELTTMLHELRPVAVEGRPVDEALRALARSHPDDAGPALHLRLANDQRASPEAGAALYRIAQEALSNAVRHADASRIDVTLDRSGDELVLGVTDDGRGFDATRSTHDGMGLRSMSQRAASVGGRLDIESRPGGGTRIVAFVPIQANEPAGPPEAAS